MIALFRVCRNTHIHTHGTDFQLQKFLPPKYWMLAIISECSVPLSLLYLCMRCETIRTSVILYQVLELDLSTSCFLYMQNILRFPARSITGSLLLMNETTDIGNIHFQSNYGAQCSVCFPFLCAKHHLQQLVNKSVRPGSHPSKKARKKKDTLWRKQIPG